MKKTIFRASLAIFVVFLACIFISCNTSSSPESEVFICETVELGTDITYSLSFDGRVATLYRQTSSSLSSFIGEITKKSDGVFLLKITSSSDDTPIPYYLVENEITISGSSFTFNNRPAIVPPAYSENEDGPQDNTDNESAPYSDNNDTPEKDDTSRPDEKDTPNDTEDSISRPDENPDTTDENPSEFTVTPINPPEPCLHENQSVIPGTPPSCTVNGYTEETVCATCKEIIIPKQPLSATGHTFSKRKCSVCEAVYLPGKYSSEPERSSSGDEQTKVVITEKSAVLLLNENKTYTLTKITSTSEIYPAEASYDNAEIILHNITTAEELSSPTASENGFEYTQKSDYEYSFSKTTETENREISEVYYFISDSLTLHGATGTYTKTVTTKEPLAGTYVFSPDSVTLTLNSGECCALDLTTDTFSILPSPVNVKYFVNDAVAFECLFPDVSEVENYLSPLSADLAALDWFVDSNGDTPYSTAVKPDVTKNALSLYAFKEYKDIFRFREQSFEINHGSYSENFSFENAADTLLAQENTSLASDGYVLSWTKDGKPVSSLSIPSTAYSLTANREFVLSVSPQQNRIGISVSDNSENATYLYFPEESRFLSCATPDEVLTLIGITESDKLNYAFVSTSDDYTSFTRTFTGITVTYIRQGEEITKKIRALEEYAIGTEYDTEIWFTADTAYSRGESVILSAPLTLYSRRFVVSHYVTDKFATSVYCGDLPAELQSDPIASYRFIGFFVNETALSEYSMPSIGEIEINAVYSSSIVTKNPTTTESGLCRQTRLSIDGETISDVELPVLSDTDYAYSVTVSPSLLANGTGLYSSTEYGDYSVTLPKLTSQRVVCGDDVYDITMESNGSATVTHNGTSYQTSATITNDSIVFSVSSQANTNATLAFAASVSSFGGFSVFEVSSEQQAENLALAPTSSLQPGTNYFSYEDNGALFISSDFYYVSDSSGTSISDYPEQPSDYFEFDGTHYIQSGLYLSFVNGIVLYSTTPSALPQSQSDVVFYYYSGVRAYKVTADSLTIAQNNEYTMTKGNTEYRGTYQISSSGKILLYISSESNAPVSFTYTSNGTPSIEVAYK